MSFRGVEAPIELAKFGLVGSLNLAAIPPSALLTANNISLDTGAINRVGGSAIYNANPITSVGHYLLEDQTGRYLMEDGTSLYLLENSDTPPGVNRKIEGLFDWWPTSVLQRSIAVTDGGEILRDPSGTGNYGVAGSGFNSASNPVFAVGGNELIGNNKKLFIANGFDPVQVFDGDAAGVRQIHNTAPNDWTNIQQPLALFSHNARMWGISGHNLYGSTVVDHEDYQSAGSVVIPVATGESSYLQGGISFKGRLFVFKWPLGVYWLDDSSTTQANWDMKRLTPSCGLASPQALCLVDDDVLFMSEIGHVHMLSSVYAFGDVKNSDLMALNELTPYIRTNISITKSDLNHVRAVYYPDRKEAHFTMRTIGSTINNVRLVVDFNKKDTPRIRFEDKDTCEALAVRQDVNRVNRPIVGDDQGTVWLLDQFNAKDKAGAGYLSEFQVPHTDFAWFNEKLATVRKNFSFLEAVMQPTGNFSLFVDVLYDGTYQQTLTLNTGGSAPVLGSFTLGVDALAGDSIVNIRKRLGGSARRISFIGRQSLPDEDFLISQMYVGFTPGGQKL